MTSYIALKFMMSLRITDSSTKSLTVSIHKLFNIQAHTILIVGEMSLPFIILSKKVVLLKHGDSGYCNYEIICRNLLYKARARGCRVILPVDFMTGGSLNLIESVSVCLSVCLSVCQSVSAARHDQMFSSSTSPL